MTQTQTPRKVAYRDFAIPTSTGRRITYMWHLLQPDAALEVDLSALEPINIREDAARRIVAAAHVRSVETKRVAGYRISASNPAPGTVVTLEQKEVTS